MTVETERIRVSLSLTKGGDDNDEVLRTRKQKYLPILDGSVTDVGDHHGDDHGKHHR